MPTTTEPTATLPRRSPRELLTDPNVLFLSLGDAAAMLGIPRSTAHRAAKRTGELIAGVPVRQFRNGTGRARWIVPAEALRREAGIAALTVEPSATDRGRIEGA